MIAVATGSDFNSGFIGGFVGKTTGHYAKQYLPQNHAMNILATASTAALTAHLTNGNPAQAAVQAAMVYVFNDAASMERDPESVGEANRNTPLDKMQDEYENMKQDNTIGNDKYFHYRANCEASKFGLAGKGQALVIDYVREVSDLVRPSKWPPDWADAQRNTNANQYGLRHDPLFGQTCPQHCSIFIVDGINPRYLPNK